jgi:ribose transport system substrate-binding protein
MHKRFRHALFTAGTTAAVAISLAACSSSATHSPSSSTTPRTGASAANVETTTSKPLAGKTIAYIQTGDIEYYEDSAAGAKAAVTALGGTTKIFDSAFDASKELANVNDAITQKVDGIVLFPLSDASTAAELRLANRANIPMTVLYGYSPAVESEGAGFVQINFYNYAKALGQEFAKQVPTGDIALISGNLGRSDVTAFHDGFVAGFGNSSRIVEQIAANYNRQLAFNDTQDIMSKHPTLTGLVVGNEDMAIGAVSALGAKISQVKIATQNGSPEGNAYLKQGKFSASVGGSPDQEAALAVNLLNQAISGHPAIQKLCQTPWAVNTSTSIQSVPWETTPAIIDGALKNPPPCSAN